MKRRDPATVGQLLRAFLRAEGLETPLNEHRLVASWPDVMGPAIARRTAHVEVRGTTLYAQITSPALRADMMMNRQEFIRRLNTHVGAQVINAMVLY